jgi:hypothetical protein
MRTASLLPVAIAAAVAACGSGPNSSAQITARVPERDLTLQGTASELEVASAIELARAPAEPARARRATSQHKRAPRIVAGSSRSVEKVAAPAPAPTATTPPSATSLVDAEAPDPHALAPGQTVTVLPASSGSSAPEPSSRGSWTDDLPASGRGTAIHAGGHGGNCGGRGGGGLGGVADAGGVLKLR